MNMCVSVREDISRTTWPNYTKVFVHVACGSGSILLWRRCNMLSTSGFMDDARYVFLCGRYGGVTQQQQPSCDMCTAKHRCCVALVASCLRRLCAPRLEEPFM